MNKVHFIQRDVDDWIFVSTQCNVLVQLHKKRKRTRQNMRERERECRGAGKKKVIEQTRHSDKDTLTYTHTPTHPFTHSYKENSSAYVQMFLKVLDTSHFLEETVHTFTVSIQNSVQWIHEKLFHTTETNVVRQVLQDFRQLFEEEPFRRGESIHTNSDSVHTRERRRQRDKERVGGYAYA
jgi:hypothetical protein